MLRSQTDVVWACIPIELKSDQWPRAELSGKPKEDIVSMALQGRYEWERGIVYLIERMRLDLREAMFHVVGVHGPNLFPGRGSKDLNDLHKLINS